MSGHKIATVTISQDEYRKLYEAEKNLRYSMNDMELLENKSQVDESRSIFDQMLMFNNQQLNALTGSIPSEIPDENKEILHLRELYDVQYNELKQIVERQDELLQQKNTGDHLEFESISDHIIQLSSKMDDMNAQVSAKADCIERIRGSNQEIVQEYIDELDFYCQSLSRYSLFPCSNSDLLARVEEGLDLAIYNATNGFLDAALSLLQTLILDAKEGLRKIELDQSLLYFLASNLGNRLKAVNQEIIKHSLVEAVTRQGSLTGVYLDLKDWGDGKYQAALAEIDNLAKWLDENFETASFDDLKRLEELIQKTEEDFIDAMHTARLNAINSQLKYEVANQILLALVSQGYVPDEGTYTDNNGKERYFAKAVNSEGTSVSVLVDTADQFQIGSKISIISSDYQQRTQTELIHRAAEIREAVSHYGLDIGNITEVPVHDEELAVKLKKKETTKVRMNR